MTRSPSSLSVSLSDMDTLAEARKEKEQAAVIAASNNAGSTASTTPDYAAALMSPGVPVSE